MPSHKITRIVVEYGEKRSERYQTAELRLTAEVEISEGEDANEIREIVIDDLTTRVAEHTRERIDVLTGRKPEPARSRGVRSPADAGTDPDPEDPFSE